MKYPKAELPDDGSIFAPIVVHSSTAVNSPNRRGPVDTVIVNLPLSIT